MTQKSTQQFSTPLAQAKGSGSAHDGVHHWINQRISAIALIPLGLFILGWIKIYGHSDYQTIITSLNNPWISAFVLLFITAASYHAALGLQIITEDYVHSSNLRRWGLVKIRLIMVLLPALSLIFLIKIMIMGFTSHLGIPF